MGTTYKKNHSLKEIYQRYWRRYFKGYDRKLYLDKEHIEAVYKTLNCRTSRLGVTCYECTSCGYKHYIHRSCGHRFCGTCGCRSTYKWSEGTLQRLLDIKHHHIVMTLPKPLRFLSKRNGNKLHDLLFKESSAVLQEWFKKKHQLRPGIVSVLHTSGSDLKYHPHVHLIVSGGGQELEGKAIKELDSYYLTRQRYLGKELRERYIEGLIRLSKKGELEQPKNWNKDEKSLKKWLNGLGEKHWIVSIQKPLSDRSKIVGYVGRYTKRACISEYKLESHSKEGIRFRYTDYKNSVRGEKPLESIKEMRPGEFLDALLQHVPKKGYRMVRYYGLYCSHYINQLPKEELKEEEEKEPEHDWGEYEELRKEDIKRGKRDPLICPHCEIALEFEGIYYPYKHKIDDS